MCVAKIFLINVFNGLTAIPISLIGMGMESVVRVDANANSHKTANARYLCF